MHCNEFEVYLCARCGAEVDCKNKTAGEPAKPEMVRPKLFDGMRVRFISHDIRGIDGKLKKRRSGWFAGDVPVGSVGTVRYHVGDYGVGWRFDWDGITPKPGYIFGTYGPFLDDDFEVIE